MANDGEIWRFTHGWLPFVYRSARISRSLRTARCKLPLTGLHLEGLS